MYKPKLKCGTSCLRCFFWFLSRIDTIESNKLSYSCSGNKIPLLLMNRLDKVVQPFYARQLLLNFLLITFLLLVQMVVENLAVVCRNALSQHVYPLM